MSERTDKTAQQIRHIVGEYIQREAELKSLFITIQDVTVTPDMRQARLWVTTLDEANLRPAIKSLKKNTREINEHIKQNVESKFSPRVSFIAGPSRDNKIDYLLDSVAKSSESKD